MRGRSIATAALTAGPLALALTGAAASRAGVIAVGEVSCFERAPVVVYLHSVQDRIMDHWQLPEDGLANHAVTVALRLDESGTLVAFELKSRTSPRLANSVLRAVADAAPFPAMTAETACLAGRTILSEFSNPS